MDVMPNDLSAISKLGQEDIFDQYDFMNEISVMGIDDVALAGVSIFVPEQNWC